VNKKSECCLPLPSFFPAPLRPRRGESKVWCMLNLNLLRIIFISLKVIKFPLLPAPPLAFEGRQVNLNTAQRHQSTSSSASRDEIVFDVMNKFLLVFPSSSRLLRCYFFSASQTLIAPPRPTHKTQLIDFSPTPPRPAMWSTRKVPARVRPALRTRSRESFRAFHIF
jgi:hypothetical protein